MNAAEVIAEHKRLTDETAALEAARAKLPKVAMPWHACWRVLADESGATVAEVWQDSGGLWWFGIGDRVGAAKPNTEAGAKADADAQLAAGGVLLA